MSKSRFNDHDYLEPDEIRPYTNSDSLPPIPTKNRGNGGKRNLYEVPPAYAPRRPTRPPTKLSIGRQNNLDVSSGSINSIGIQNTAHSSPKQCSFDVNDEIIEYENSDVVLGNSNHLSPPLIGSYSGGMGRSATQRKISRNKSKKVINSSIADQITKAIQNNIDYQLHKNFSNKHFKNLKENFPRIRNIVDQETTINGQNFYFTMYGLAKKLTCHVCIIDEDGEDDDIPLLISPEEISPEINSNLLLFHYNGTNYTFPEPIVASSRNDNLYKNDLIGEPLNAKNCQEYLIQANVNEAENMIYVTNDDYFAEIIGTTTLHQPNNLSKNISRKDFISSYKDEQEDSMSQIWKNFKMFTKLLSVVTVFVLMILFCLVNKLLLIQLIHQAKYKNWGKDKSAMDTYLFLNIGVLVSEIWTLIYTFYVNIFKKDIEKMKSFDWGLFLKALFPEVLDCIGQFVFIWICIPNLPQVISICSMSCLYIIPAILSGLTVDTSKKFTFKSCLTNLSSLAGAVIQGVMIILLVVYVSTVRSFTLAIILLSCILMMSCRFYWNHSALKDCKFFEFFFVSPKKMERRRGVINMWQGCRISW